MILYNLTCAKRHEFEAWFRDSAAYEVQVGKRAIACPECGSTKISKAPMAPRLSRGRAVEHEIGGASASSPSRGQNSFPNSVRPSGVVPKEGAVMARKTLEALRKQIEEKCEYVGERFPEEARKIHYGEAARRDIYGEASDEAAKALTEEGVEFHRIPWIRRTES